MGWDGDDTTLGILTAVINEKKVSSNQMISLPTVLWDIGLGSS